MSEERETAFRNKVIWFSFVFSLLVIWVHSYNAELYLGKTPEMEVIYRIEYWLGDGIAQIAVPGFFMISGYLFYRDFTWKKLRSKWNRRIRSVLVPYILWNFLYYLGYVIGSRIPWVRDVVGKGTIPFDLNTMADAVIHYTYNYVFWYLFQLIILILLAPVLYPILKNIRSRFVLLVVLGIVILLDVRLPVVNADALLYYSVAASAALTSEWRKIVEKGSGSKAWGAGLLILAVFSYDYGLSKAVPIGFVLCRLLAVSGLWLLIPAEKLPVAKDFMQCNFFLYATHFAIVRFINKAGAEILHITSAVPLVLFLFMPVLALAVCTLTGGLLRRLSPEVWNWLNGGR